MKACLVIVLTGTGDKVEEAARVQYEQSKLFWSYDEAFFRFQHHNHHLISMANVTMLLLLKPTILKLRAEFLHDAERHHIHRMHEPNGVTLL